MHKSNPYIHSQWMDKKAARKTRNDSFVIFSITFKSI